MTSIPIATFIWETPCHLQQLGKIFRSRPLTTALLMVIKCQMTHGNFCQKYYVQRELRDNQQAKATFLCYQGNCWCNNLEYVIRQLTTPVLEMRLHISNVFLFDSSYNHSCKAFFSQLFLYKFLDTLFISWDVGMVSSLPKKSGQNKVTKLLHIVLQFEHTLYTWVVLQWRLVVNGERLTAIIMYNWMTRKYYLAFSQLTLTVAQTRHPGPSCWEADQR